MNPHKVVFLEVPVCVRHLSPEVIKTDKVPIPLGPASWWRVTVITLLLSIKHYLPT